MKDFNFFEPYMAKKKKKGSEKKTITVIVLGGLLAVGIYIPVQNYTQLMNLKQEVETLRQQANSDNEEKYKVKRIEELRQQVTKMEEEYNQLTVVKEKIDQKSTVDESLLLEIVTIIPQQLFLETMGLNASGGELRGIASNQLEIASFEQGLRQIPSIEEVFIPNISKDGEDYRFTIRFSIKDVTDDEMEAN